MVTAAHADTVRAQVASATTPYCVNLATGSSASCTGCLDTGNEYDENTAWVHHDQDQQGAA